MLNPSEFDRRTAAIGTAALFATAAFALVLGYWQIWRTDLADRAGNPRVLAAFHDPARGRILDRDGNALAVSLPDGTRRYTDASVAHAVGYLSARYGMQGAELAFNSVLSGASGSSWEAAVNAEFRRGAQQGFDVKLTLDPQVQAAAVSAFGARNGAVIALDPRNGEVLAMVSVPTYDPGSLDEKGAALLDDPDSPMLNRATQGLYPPGSTFKTVTAAAALSAGTIKPDTTVTCPEEIVIDGFPISCRNVTQGPGTYPFKHAFTYSVNAIFAQVGVDLGWTKLLDMARKFGFGAPIPFTLDTAASRVLPEGAERSKVLLATTAFGQGQLLATPLQMVSIAATIANGGVFVHPHLGLAVMDGDRTVRALEGPSSERVLSPEVAATLNDFMVSVVDAGQAAGAAIPGVKVGGKTGTAETGHDTSHAWFIAFAPAEDPVVAVAVVVEDGGRGGEVASPIAGEVLRAALGK